MVSFDGLEDGEIGNILDWRWWDPGELTDGMTLSSLKLPMIAQRAVAACADRSR